MALPPRALAVLAALVATPGTIVSKQALLDAGWRDAFVTESSLLEAIGLLRDALGDDRRDPRFIQTVHRRGYRFVATTTKVQEFKGSRVQEFKGSRVQEFEGSRVQGFKGSTVDESLQPLMVGGIATVVATVGVAVVFALFGQAPQTPRPTARFTIALPEDMPIDPLRGSVAVSDDGSRMVYVAMHKGRSRLFLRSIDTDLPALVEGSDDAGDPFFAPDGDWIGFFAHGSLKKIRAGGGTPVVLCAARAGAGAAWTRDGTIIFGGGPGGSLARVSEEGGEPVVLAAPASGSRDLSYGWPELLPDNRGVLYTATSLADHRIGVLDLSNGTRHTIVEGAAFGRYSPTGHLIFERRGRLEAAPFSVSEWKLSALPRAILRGIATGGTPLTGPRFAFSRTGSLIYVPTASNEVDDRLHWLDTGGRLEPVPIPPGPLGGVDIAPDLRQVAVSVQQDGRADLWIGDLQRGGMSRLTADGPSVSPTWRPDGLEIAFAYSKAGPFNLFIRPPSDDGVPTPLFASPWNQFPTSWSPDARLLAFTEIHPLTGSDIWVLDVNTRERRPLVRTLFEESHARFSPDGRSVAYMSNESGRWDVFVRPVGAAGPRVQVSTDGGAWPCWSVDGRTLYFSTAHGAAASAIDTIPALVASAPMMIPGRQDVQLAASRAAGNRVLVRQDGLAPSRRELRVVLEWFAEVARLAL